MDKLTDAELNVAITAVCGLIYQRVNVETRDREYARTSLLAKLLDERLKRGR